MGFFSWMTADTKEAIDNCHFSTPRRVHLLQPNGKPAIVEDAYEGYGVFGDVDAYEWLATNNLNADKIAAIGGELREIGILLQFKEPERVRFPLKFSFNPNARYERLAASKDDPRQGMNPDKDEDD